MWVYLRSAWCGYKSEEMTLTVDLVQIFDIFSVFQSIHRSLFCHNLKSSRHKAAWALGHGWSIDSFIHQFNHSKHLTSKELFGLDIFFYCPSQRRRQPPMFLVATAISTGSDVQCVHGKVRCHWYDPRIVLFSAIAWKWQNWNTKTNTKVAVVQICKDIIIRIQFPLVFLDLECLIFTLPFTNIEVISDITQTHSHTCIWHKYNAFETKP